MMLVNRPDNNLVHMIKIKKQDEIKRCKTNYFCKLHKLHRMKENVSNHMLSDNANDGTMNINGCKPYWDCLNDLLDAIYSKKGTIIRDYIPTQYYAEWNGNYDPLYFNEERELDLQDHGHTSVPIHAFIEQESVKIAREIEKYLIGKYAGMDGDE